ncbi:MAG TPA: ATP-binding protein, partial [Polyangia bacterium]|nr:ATP-binding protein [Polyangia bacterium]
TFTADWEMSLVVAAGLLGSLCSMAILRRTGRIALATNLITFSAYAVYAGAAFRTGAIGLPGAYFGATIPLFVALMAGWRSAVAWCAASTGLTVWLAFALAGGHVFPDRPGPEATQRLHIGAAFLFGFALCAIGAAYEWLKNSAVRRMEAANRDLEEARRSAEVASRVKSEFLANMSHEIRTPMNGVLGMAELLLDTDLQPEQRELAETMSRSATALLAILNDILDTSKIESGRVEIERVPFDLRLVANEVARLLSQRAREKGLSFACRYPEDAPRTFLGDPVRVRQILTNLAGNAVKFTNHGSVGITVTIGGLTPDGADVDIRVADTGIGIESHLLESIFEKFTQADASTNRHFGGTGLGLSISRDLVGLMGGTIAAESRPGRGSSFRIRLRLPLADAPATEPKPRPLPRQRPEAHLLVAEDNPVNQLLVVKMLERLGCRVTLACNGVEALDALEKASFDLVLMDCQMPTLDGFEASTEIRRREAKQGAPRIPIVALTANAMQGDRERCLAAGMDDYLTKPLKRETLERTLDRWLG